MKTITFAVPFLNEAENLARYPARIREIRQRVKARCKFVFIDDGSTDSSAETVKGFREKYITLIQLSKNYGSHLALFSALENCDTDYFTFMSADMQEPIDLFEDMFQQAKSGAEIVLGERQNRVASLKTRLFSRLYNGLVRRFAFPDFPPKGVDIVFLNRKVIEAMASVKEKNSSFYGVLFTLGFAKAFSRYTQLPRTIGKSKWTFAKNIKLITDTFISFTVFPLRLVTYTGFALFTGGLLYGCYLVYLVSKNGIVTPGYATTVVILSLGFGLNFLFLGIISEYLWRMFDQVRPRPRYVIREIVKM